MVFIAAILVAFVHAHGGSQGVIVRVTGFNPITNEYNFSCIVPEKNNASNIGSLKFYDIDPTPSFYPSRHNFRSEDPNVTWRLDPINFEEEVHTNAMYHIYCEVQNFSAPSDKQNLASEFHVDLRTTHNQEDPNIYVLSSEGKTATLKCDPPPGTRRYTLSWGLRDRNGITTFPSLANQRIVNITAPVASAGWDITCDVFDKDSGKTSHWDMPIEFFESGPVYVPTIEGCVLHEPCTWVHPSGIPPNGTLILNITLNSTSVQSDIYINEILMGTTNASGFLTLQNITPGLHNLVIRKPGYNEISTLVPIGSGKTLYRNYSISENVSVSSSSACFSNVFGIPSSCQGGIITTDDVSGGCRMIICANSTSNMKILACDKPSTASPQYYEMYKQFQNGSSVRQICIGSTCIRDSGFARSGNFPICTGNATSAGTSNGSLRVSTIPNFADVYLGGTFRGNSGLIGSLIMDNLIPATYQLIVRKANYTDNISQVNVISGELVDVQARLSPNSTSINTSINSTSNNTNTTSSNSTTNLTTTITVCSSSLRNISANCSGGIITSDITTSGRTIICTNGNHSLRIQAWEKPDLGAKQYFEMYRQSKVGTLVTQICIDSTCISDNGYARSSNYPICFNKTIILNQTNTTNTTQINAPIQNASLRVNTTPTEADIYLNNTQMGTTDSTGVLDIFNLIAGFYHLIIRKIGFLDYDNMLTLNPGQNLSISANLTSSPANSTNTSGATNPSKDVYVRVVSSNPSTRTYTFSCRMNPENNFLRDWFIRPDRGNLSEHLNEEAQFLDMQSGEFLTYTFQNDTFYHIACLIINETSNELYRGDLHIDLRNHSWNPEIIPISSEGMTATYECMYNGPDYQSSWEVVNVQAQNTTSLGTGNTITHTAPNQGLFDYVCHVNDLGTGNRYSTGLPVEYFADGDPYFPDSEGVPDGINNNWIRNNTNQASNSSTINTPPFPPIWLEPQQNKTNMDPFDFHLQVFGMSDEQNDSHIATDFEIWDNELNQRVWSALYSSVLTHIHNADGIFENNLSGAISLLYDKNYRVRARFYEDSASDNVSNFSEWRYFRTKSQFNVSSNFSWTAQPGFKVEKVASNISFPVSIHMAPSLYSHLSQGQQPLLYVTQLYGQIGMIRKNGQYVRYADNLLNYFPGSLPGTGESGVVGLYVDDLTGDVFASMVYMNSSSKLVGKVVRFFTNDDGTTYTGSMTILDKIPVDYSHQVQSLSRGPDGKLYLGTGDANSLGGAEFDRSKDPTQMSGKILRFNDDGSIPSDNPFPGTYTYAGGFRNPFGHAWNLDTDELFVTSNGADSDDGVYRVLPGDIFGWCCNTEIGTWYDWKNTTAPTQAAFNPGISGFPHDLSGHLFVALSGPTYKPGPDRDGKRIVKFSFAPNGSVGSIEDFAVYTGSGYSAPIGLAFGDDGLYFTDIYGKQGITSWPMTSGNIYKVVPGNQTEDPEGHGDSNETASSFTVTLGPARWYPQGMNMVWECNGQGGSGRYEYIYNFGDGTSSGRINRTDVWHTYPANGTYNASCIAFDLETSETATATSVVGIGSAPSSSPPPVQNGTLLVNSIPNFTNIFLNNVLKGTTDFNGILSAPNIIPGNYQIKATKTNYEDDVRAITINSGQVLIVNVTLEPISSTCYSNVENIPASCTGGNIALDSFGGCRTIICSSGASSMRILACNKPDNSAPQFFEMYKQFHNGTSVSRICIDGACISDNGYARSEDYPICL